MSAEHDDVLDEIGRIGLVPVVTLDAADRAAGVGAALLAGGLPCAEITFRTAAAPDAIRAITAAHPGLLVGAGTVTSVVRCEEAVAAGARFVVAPGFDDEVVDWCRSRGVPVLPGVMTPTEIGVAVRHGLTTLKFFPAAAAGGVAALRAIGAAFPEVRFVPTGGIGIDDVADYLRLPTVVACGGSWITPHAAVAAGDFARIEQLAADAVAVVRRTSTDR